MPPDVILATVECARWDYRDHLQPDADLDAHKGITAGHYTRPSLAAVHAPTWASLLQTQVRGPTLAEAFADAGYRTAALSYSPQTTTAFGFDRGFAEAKLREPDGGPLGRGSRLRERLAGVAPVRWLHRRLQDKHAVFDDIAPDADVVTRAHEAIATTDGPLFLWVHFMGSHRPYGWGGDGIDADVSRALASAGPDSPVSEAAAERARAAYTDALGRVSDHLDRLLGLSLDNTVVWICGDHGEELGADGYWLHAGHRRRVVDQLVEVPVFTNVAVDGPVSLLDTGAYLTEAAGIDAPDAWAARRDRETFLTVAPWNDRATVRVQTPAAGVDLRFTDSELPGERNVEVSRDVEQQLEALGYAGAG